MSQSAFVIEPQLMFVERLTQVLSMAGYQVVGASQYLDVRAIVDARPEMIFLDPDFTMESPHEAVASARAVSGTAAICVYTQRREEGLGVKCVSAGAHCVLSKQAPEEEILKAVAGILAGEIYVDPRVDDGRPLDVPTSRSAADDWTRPARA